MEYFRFMLCFSLIMVKNNNVVLFTGILVVDWGNAEVY